MSKVNPKVFVLLQAGRAVSVYTDEALCAFDAWLCNQGEKFSDDPEPYAYKEFSVNTDTYLSTQG